MKQEEEKKKEGNRKTGLQLQPNDSLAVWDAYFYESTWKGMPR